LEHRKIPDLRARIDKSPVAQRKEITWDNKCYRISVRNEKVHKHYRTLFEHITEKNKKKYF